MPDESGDAPVPAVLPVALVEDVEDLKAQVAQLSATLQALTESNTGGGEEGLSSKTEPDDAGTTPDPDVQEEDEWQYPPFILLLEGELYDREFRALIEWVEGVLVRGYLAEPSSDARWCHLWMEHIDAVAHLHALWLAWQELTDPASCGYTGPSAWHRDHYRPCMNELRGPHGPFAGCTKGEHRIEHRLPGRVPSAWYQTE